MEITEITRITFENSEKVKEFNTWLTKHTRLSIADFYPIDKSFCTFEARTPRTRQTIVTYEYWVNNDVRY